MIILAEMGKSSLVRADTESTKDFIGPLPAVFFSHITGARSCANMTHCIERRKGEKRPRSLATCV